MGLMFPLLRFFIAKGLLVNEKNAKAELQNLEDLFEEMDELLQDGREFINGKSLSFADITFAALVAPFCLPQINEFGGGKADQTKIQFPRELQDSLEIINERHATTVNYVRNLYKSRKK